MVLYSIHRLKLSNTVLKQFGDSTILLRQARTAPDVCASKLSDWEVALPSTDSTVKFMHYCSDNIIWKLYFKEHHILAFCFIN